MTDLIGELSTRSEVFRTWWAAHDVRLHRSGVKRLHHPEIGELTLAYESLELVTDPGLRLNAYTAEPGSPAQEAPNLLASWCGMCQMSNLAIPVTDHGLGINGVPRWSMTASRSV